MVSHGDNSCHSVVECAAEHRAGIRRCVDTLAESISRAGIFDSIIKTHSYFDAEQAMAEAAALDRQLASGQDPGPLCGVPLSIKDNIVTLRMPTGCASAMLEGWIPGYEATVVERLRRAGAVVLGKTNMDEFAMGSSGERSLHGPCRNPWSPAHVCGGSSSGSAAAVSAGICLAALGSDTGGSVRQPAAFCGVTGLRPTYGRVSRHGLVAFASSLDQIGPLARSAEDCAALFQVIAGHDGRDSTSLAAKVPDFLAEAYRNPAGLRLGVCGGLDEMVELAQASAMAAAVEQLSALGLPLTAVELPSLERALDAYLVLCMCEASSNLARFDGVRHGNSAGRDGDWAEVIAANRGRGFGPEVRRRLMLGTFALSAGHRGRTYDRARRLRGRVAAWLAQQFEQCDLLLLPSASGPAFELNQRMDDPVEMYHSDIFMVLPSLAGAPAISLPCGFCPEGRPLGLQLVAAPGREDRLFRVAMAYQRRTSWHLRRPDLAWARSTAVEEAR